MWKMQFNNFYDFHNLFRDIFCNINFRVLIVLSALFFLLSCCIRRHDEEKETNWRRNIFSFYSLDFIFTFFSSFAARVVEVSAVFQRVIFRFSYSASALFVVFVFLPNFAIHLFPPPTWKVYIKCRNEEEKKCSRKKKNSKQEIYQH